MMQPSQEYSPEEAAQQQDVMDQLRQTFATLPNPIDLYLFTSPVGEDVFADATRQVVRAFRQLTDKITFREYDLGHDLAREWGVHDAPTIVVAPETYNIHWLGAPMGEEGRTLLELLMLVGMGESGLSEQSKQVVAKIDSPRKIKVFVSPTCPYCPQQAVNAIRAVIENPEMISLELIDIQCKPAIAEQYSAQSVPQAFANDVLIGMGAQGEEVFMSSLLKLEPQTVFIPESDAELVETDLVVVGGGPAGLTAGIYAIRSGLKCAVIERDALGGQVALTPVVENYPGFTQVGGKTLVDIMVSHALQYVQIFQGEEVVSVTPGDPITVQTSRRKFQTRTLLLATGAKHKLLGVPGEQRLAGRGVSYCATCDGPLFRDRRVIMVGGGNSAVTEALHLNNVGVDVTMVHRRDAFRAQDVLADKVREAGIEVIWNTEVKEIQGQERVNAVVLKNNVTGEETTRVTDGVFMAIGYKPSVKLAASMGVDLNDEGYIKHDSHHRTNIPGVYSAGDVEGGYKQIVTATGQGAAAAMTIFEDLINPYWLKQAAG